MNPPSVKNLIKFYETNNNPPNTGPLSMLTKPVINASEKIKTMTPYQRSDFYEKTVLDEAKYNIILCESRIYRWEKFGKSRLNVRNEDKLLNNKFDELHKTNRHADKTILRNVIRSREMQIEQEVNQLIESSRKMRMEKKKQ